MNINAMVYPDTFVIGSDKFNGKRNASTKEVLIPYTAEPDVMVGQTVTQIVGKNEVKLKVLDIKMLPGGTRKLGTKHNNMLTLTVENMTQNEHKPAHSQNTFNIGSVSGSQVQIGENNHLLVNISITELVEKVANSGDPKAKSILKELLNNSTVANVIGAGASALIGLL